MNTETKYKFADIFLEKLKDLRVKHEIGNVYYQLFKVLQQKELDNDIQRIYKTYKGEDSFHKEDGKQNWFYYWHKSVRQCDYFNNVFGYTVVDKLTDEERKELENLNLEMSELKERVLFKIPKKSNDSHYKKREESYKVLYQMEEYKVLLNKIRKLNSIEQSREDICLGGIMDSLLWSTVYMDNKNFLYEVFLRTFAELDIQEKINSLNSKVVE